MLTLAEALLLLLLDEDSGKQSGWVHAVDAGLEGAMRLDAELGAPVPDGDAKPVERVGAGLAEKGVLGEERSKTLGLFKSVRFPERDPRPEQELRQRLRTVLVDGAEPTEWDALLLSLLVPLDLVKRVVDRSERKATEARAKEVADRGPVGESVRKEVQDEVTAMIVSTVLITTTTTTINSN
jgi:hypothetical protein